MTRIVLDDLIEQKVDALTVDKLTVVRHGATAGTSRPSTSSSVLWIGTVQPTNAVEGDIVIRDTSGDVTAARALVTSGDVTITATSNANLGPEVTVEAEVGDWVLISLSTKYKAGSNEANARLALYSVNRGGYGNSDQWTSWHGVAGQGEQPISGAMPWQITAQDLSGGTATFQLHGRVLAGTGTNRILAASSGNALCLFAQVLP